MNREYALTLLHRMVEIPSPSGAEAELANYLVGEMKSLGFRSHVDRAGNAVGEIGTGDRPRIMLLGHLDTVPSQLPVHQEASVLYGRGAVDAKGALATFVCAAAAAQDLPARLVVVGAVEEETSASRGAHYLLEGEAPDAVIIGEPSGWDRVVLGYKGRVGFQYRLRVPPSHPAGPGMKAGEEAIAFWRRLRAHLDDLAGETDGVFRRPTATLYRLEADMEEAAAYVACRIPPDFDGHALLRFVEETAGQARVEADELTPGVVVPRGAPTVRALRASIAGQGGRPGLTVKTGTSDMNIVAKRWQVPMAAYGPGDSALDHAPDEHIDLEEYLRAARVLADALPELAAELGSAAETATYTADEEAELTRRLQALGYVE